MIQQDKSYKQMHLLQLNKFQMNKQLEYWIQEGIHFLLGMLGILKYLVQRLNYWMNHLDKEQE